MQVHEQLVEGGVAELELVGLDPRHLAVFTLDAKMVQLAGLPEAEAVFHERRHPLVAEKRVLVFEADKKGWVG